jgi:hypothetical protein
MAFDFPNSPTNGQVFAPTGGPVYVYTGGVWKMQGSGQVVTAEARNRIVNPAMQISQENGDTAGTTDGFFFADQWCGNFSTSPGTIDLRRIQSVTPNGSKNRVRLVPTTADTSLAAGEFLFFYQAIEGIRIADFRYGAASAKQSILRFGFAGPAGTYSIALHNGAFNRSYIANFTVTAGQANTDTEQIFVIPGDVTGTWATDTSLGMALRVTVAAGSTYQGVTGWQAGQKFATAATSNGLGIVNNTFVLWDVGLYLDPNATGVPPPWQMPDEAQELAACQRYFNIYFNLIVVSSAPTPQSFIWNGPMRIAPAITGGGAGFGSSGVGPQSAQMYQTGAAAQHIVTNARM